jgi:AraC-like DNA-binding protein
MSAPSALLPAVLHIGRVPPQRRPWQMPEHVHEGHHEFIVVVAGQIETRIRGQVLLGRPGDVLFYPRRCPHQECACGPEELETIFLGWDDHGTVTTDDWPLCVADASGRMTLLARWVHELASEGGAGVGVTGMSETSGGAGVRPALLGALVLAMAHQFAAGRAGPEHEMVRRVSRHIQSRLTRHITLDELAAAAGLSRFHFCRVFHRITGRSPMRFLAERRVEAARALLLSSSVPLRQVALWTGFPDEFQFSRVFRRITGGTPGRVRPRRRGRIIAPGRS